MQLFGTKGQWDKLRILPRDGQSRKGRSKTEKRYSKTEKVVLKQENDVQKQEIWLFFQNFEIRFVPGHLLLPLFLFIAACTPAVISHVTDTPIIDLFLGQGYPGSTCSKRSSWTTKLSLFVVWPGFG